LFKEGFDDLEQKLGARHYISVTAFSADISAVFSAVLTRSDENMTELRDVTDVHNQLNEVPAGTAKHLALTQEQKELKRLTKRIVKAIKDPLEAAMKKEAELKGIPFEKEMSEWAAFDARLENSIQTNGMTALPTMEIDETISPDASVSAVAGASPRRVNNNTDEDVEMTDVSNVASETIDTVHAKLDSDIASVKVSKFKPAQPLSPPNSTSSAAANHNNNNNIDANIDHTAQDTTAPPIEAPTSDPWAQGGVPWYLEAFDISGTTVHEERWTGPDTMRAMSEQLSEMDEETLQDLVGNTNTASSNTEDETNTTSAAASKGRTRSSARFRRVEEADIATVADDDEEDEDEDDVVAETEETEEEEEEEEVQETEEEKAAREKREKANARRRAQRRKNR
jgi:NuA3 HAT complex component NTO1